MQENDIVTLMYSTLCSLNYLHSAGLMHRKLEPSNILVDQDNGILIGDMSIARSIPE